MPRRAELADFLLDWGSSVVGLGFKRQQVGRAEPWLSMRTATDGVSIELTLKFQPEFQKKMFFI